MEELKDIKGISKLLDVKEPTIRAWVFQKRIPIVRVGRLIRFSPSEINKWLSRQNRASGSARVQDKLVRS